MKPIILNFLSVIRRFKLAVVLNILGLSVAFAAFMVIMIQLDYDYGFDKFHKDSDKIFRMECSWGHSTQTIVSRPLAEHFFESSPHIVAGALWTWGGKAFFHAESDNERHFHEEVSSITPGFTGVFSFDFVEGTEDALKTPGNGIIPLTLSRKIFGNEPAVGKMLVSAGGNITVGAVYRDFPDNTVLKNNIYVPIPEDEEKDNWSNYSYIAYIRVNQASNAHLLCEDFMRNFQIFNLEESGVKLRLTALPDIRYVTDVQYDIVPKASKQTLMILFLIAIIIIVIAGINFTNFSMALTPMRVKSLNTQKVLGARQRTLRLSVVSEAVIICLSAYFVAIWFVMWFNESPLAKLVDADLSISAHPLIFGGTALIALLTGLLAGVYPAFYMTAFAPALVLNGNFGLSPKGKKLRNTLIGIQFIASFALIIGASFMYLQNYFMQNSPLGYEKDALITVDIQQIQGSRDAFTNQLKSFSGIEDVTYGERVLSSQDSYMGWGRKYNGEQINFQCLPVNYTFLKALGIEVSEGRDFRQEDANTEHGAYVFNATAREMYNLEIGTTIENRGEIIGFMHDIKFASFRKAVEPMAFYVWGTSNWGDRLRYVYIKLKPETNLRAAMSHIRKTLSGFDAGFPFEVRFHDEVLQRLYEKETALSALISLFSLIAIFISIAGVFGLVVFDSECRRKEIGIRKVFGASTTGIIVMFNKMYFKILAVCFIIAAPLAWYAVHHWLENFAYKTPMYWWVYLLAFVVVAAITVGTVTFQNWRVASENPVGAINN